MTRNTIAPYSRANAQAHRHRKRVRVVRVIVSETAWLDGRLRWHAGRVVWQDERGLMDPDASDLALAQRRLNQIGCDAAARRVLGDVAAWLARRRAHLQLARQLHAINAPDLPALVQPVHMRHPQVVRRLVSLLPAEALCLGPLPASPAVALLACGERAAAPLRAVITDEGTPPHGRALAALLLGAVEGDTGGGQAGGLRAAPTDNQLPIGDWLRRAYDWGCNAGLPPDPALIVALLADDDGIALARRGVQALHSTSPFRLSTELLRELLADNVPPTTVVALAEAAAATEPLVARMIQRRSELPPEASRQRRALAERLLQQRQQIVADLAAVAREYVIITRDPATFGLITRFAYDTLALGALTPELAATLINTLRDGLALPHARVASYLNLLVERHRH